MLLDSYANLDRDLRRKLLLIGKFRELDKMEEFRVKWKINKYGIRSEVQMTGFVGHPEILDYLLLMRVFVQCSKHEGLPNTILEAASLGLPIVASAIDGMKDILEDGKSAILVPPEDPEKLTDAIELVIRDEVLAQNLSREAKKVARSLNPESEKKAWIHLYRSLV